MALRALAAAAGLVVVAAACSSDGEPDAATTTTDPVTSTMDTTTSTVLMTTFDDVWSATPAPASSCLVVVKEDMILADRNGDLPLIPASTLKLLVAAAAPDDPRVTAILRGSDNDAARALVDDLGGLDAVRAIATEEGVVVRDATGHDRANRIPCWTFVRILRTFDLRDSLAVAGESGTLAGRLVEHRGRIRAKTGSISGVGALAGYAGDLVFAMVLNEVEDPEPVFEVLANALVP